MASCARSFKRLPSEQRGDIVVKDYWYTVDASDAAADAFLVTIRCDCF